jgi:hypothetical protein
MLENLKELEGKAFVFNKIKYNVETTKMVKDVAVIRTDRKTFTFLPSAFETWLGEVLIFEDTPGEANVTRKEWIPAAIIPAKITGLQTELIASENNAVKVSNKLMEVFETLSSNPTDEAYKKASAMVQVANSIINAQKHIFQIKTYNQ